MSGLLRVSRYVMSLTKSGEITVALINEQGYKCSSTLYPDLVEAIQDVAKKSNARLEMNIDELMQILQVSNLDIKITITARAIYKHEPNC